MTAPTKSYIIRVIDPIMTDNTDSSLYQNFCRSCFHVDGGPVNKVTVGDVQLTFVYREPTEQPDGCVFLVNENIGIRTCDKSRGTLYGEPITNPFSVYFGKPSKSAVYNSLICQSMFEWFAERLTISREAFDKYIANH